MKTTLSIEESANLIELGVDANKASEIEYRPKKCGYGRIGYRVYSLADLLSILPKEIDGNVLDSLATGYNKETEKLEKGWTATFIDKQCIPSFGEDAIFSAPELIDALNQLLIWCLEQGHCKCGKGGGR